MATSSKLRKLTSADISNAKPVRKRIRLISRQELVDIVGVSFPSIWQWVREGKFPPPRKLGKGGRTAWLESEIEADECPPSGQSGHAFLRRLRSSYYLKIAWTCTHGGHSSRSNVFV
jgi:predicted DNA-binding transcriptional regulator AlpA